MELTDKQALSLYILLQQNIKHLNEQPARLDPVNRRNDLKMYTEISTKLDNLYPAITAFKKTLQ